MGLSSFSLSFDLLGVYHVLRILEGAMTRTIFFLAFTLSCTPTKQDTAVEPEDTAEDTASTDVTFEILSVTIEHGSALRVKVDTSTPALGARLVIDGSVYEEWDLEDIEPVDPCASPEQGDGTRWGLCATDSAWAPTLQETGRGTVYATGPDGEGRYAEISVEVAI